MKKKILLMVAFVIIVFIVAIVSCSKNENTDVMDNDFKLPEIVFGEGARIGSFKLPDATRIA